MSSFLSRLRRVRHKKTAGWPCSACRENLSAEKDYFASHSWEYKIKKKVNLECQNRRRFRPQVYRNPASSEWRPSLSDFCLSFPFLSSGWRTLRLFVEHRPLCRPWISPLQEHCYRSWSWPQHWHASITIKVTIETRCRSRDIHTFSSSGNKMN